MYCKGFGNNTTSNVSGNVYLSCYLHTQNREGVTKAPFAPPRWVLAVRSRPLLTPPFLVVGFVASHPPFPTVGLLHFSSSSIQRQPPPQRHHHGRRQGQAGAKAKAHGGEAAAQHLPQEHVRAD